MIGLEETIPTLREGRTIERLLRHACRACMCKKLVHLSTQEEEEKVIGWIIRAAVEVNKEKRDEGGVDTPRRAQPRQAE